MKARLVPAWRKVEQQRREWANANYHAVGLPACLLKIWQRCQASLNELEK